jgi:hypothetical protein
MAFYTPESQTALPVLRLCQQIQADRGRSVHVLAFALTEDAGLVRRQHTELGLTFPVLAGKGLRQNYRVDATPQLMLLDADGVVRASYTGWGPEIGTTVAEELGLLVAETVPLGRP